LLLPAIWPLAATARLLSAAICATTTGVLPTGGHSAAANRQLVSRRGCRVYRRILWLLWHWLAHVWLYGGGHHHADLWVHLGLDLRDDCGIDYWHWADLPRSLGRYHLGDVRSTLEQQAQRAQDGYRQIAQPFSWRSAYSTPFG